MKLPKTPGTARPPPLNDTQLDTQAEDAHGDGFSTCDGDCDDLSDAAYPGGGSDGLLADRNCDGAIDSGLLSEADGDCNDNDPDINPEASDNVAGSPD